MLCGDECGVSHVLMYCGIVQRLVVLELQLRTSRGGCYSRFEAMCSLEKASFILGNKLWEECFGDVVKDHENLAYLAEKRCTTTLSSDSNWGSWRYCWC